MSYVGNVFQGAVATAQAMGVTLKALFRSR